MPVGEETRDFESLTQDLALMQDLGVNTIRVYEPIASKAVLDEITTPASRSLLDWGTTKVASTI